MIKINYPDFYDNHLNNLWQKHSASLPTEIQNDHYRDHVFKPQQWLRDAMTHYGFTEEYTSGIQSGMSDWIINLANQPSSGLSTIEYVKSFFANLINNQHATPQQDQSAQQSENHPNPIESQAEMLGTAVVLNESMKRDDNKCLIFSPNADITGSQWITHLRDETYLGIGWIVGEEKNGDKTDTLIWLENGDTCWISEVKDIHTEAVDANLWKEFNDNATRTTIGHLRSNRNRSSH